MYSGAEYIFPDGYIEVIDGLAEELKIIKNQDVVEIDYSGDQVTVYTNDDKEYTADKVVVAIPLALLKEDHIDFVPALKSDK